MTLEELQSRVEGLMQIDTNLQRQLNEIKQQIVELQTAVKELKQKAKP